MRVVVGPVPGSSAKAWLAYAREVLSEMDDLGPEAGIDDAAVVDVFEAYIRQWERAARKRTFHWEADIPAEQVEYDMHAFQKVAELLARREQRTGRTHAPEEGEEFYQALLNGVLSALEVEGPSHAAFATHLEEFWPGHQS